MTARSVSNAQNIRTPAIRALDKRNEAWSRRGARPDVWIVLVVVACGGRSSKYISGAGWDGVQCGGAPSDRMAWEGGRVGGWIGQGVASHANWAGARCFVLCGKALPTKVETMTPGTKVVWCQHECPHATGNAWSLRGARFRTDHRDY